MTLDERNRPPLKEANTSHMMHVDKRYIIDKPAHSCLRYRVTVR